MAAGALTYNANGLPTSLGLIGLPHTVQYDGLDQVTQLTDPSGQITTLSYDALGNLTQIILPDGTIAESSTYDAVGNLVAATDSLGNVTRYAYDGVDRLLQTTLRRRLHRETHVRSRGPVGGADRCARK